MIGATEVEQEQVILAGLAEQLRSFVAHQQQPLEECQL